MFRGNRREAWEQTIAIQRVWTKHPDKNPYRREKQFTPMQPAELYAMQKAIENRKRRREKPG